MELAHAQGQLLDSAGLAKKKTYLNFGGAINHIDSVYKLEICTNKLSFYHNIYKDSVQASISKFKNLQVLRLGSYHNVYPSFNKILLNIGNLKNLQVLHLEGNLFETDTITQNILNLTNLKELYLSGTYIKSFPKQIDKLQKLEILRLPFGIDVNLLLPSIIKLKNLKELYLYLGNVKELPNDFLKLKHLKKLILYVDLEDEKTDYKKLISLLNQMKNIEIVSNFNYSSIKKLPQEITQIKNLKSVSLQKCDSLDFAQAFEMISQNKSIEALDLSMNHFDSLPDQFLLLKDQIRSLNFSKCDFIGVYKKDREAYKNLFSINDSLQNYLNSFNIKSNQVKLDCVFIKLHTFQELKYLNLSLLMGLKNIDKLDICPLEELDLSYNSIDYEETINILKHHEEWGCKSLKRLILKQINPELITEEEKAMGFDNSIDLNKKKYLLLELNTLNNFKYSDVASRQRLELSNNSKSNFYNYLEIGDISYGRNLDFKKIFLRLKKEDFYKYNPDSYYPAKALPLLDIELLLWFNHDNIINAEIILKAWKEQVLGDSIKEKNLFINGYELYRYGLETPLMLAVKAKQLKVIKLLYENGARDNIKGSIALFNKEAKNSFDIAKESAGGGVNVISLLFTSPQLYFPILEKKIKEQDILINRILTKFSKLEKDNKIFLLARRLPFTPTQEKLTIEEMEMGFGDFYEDRDTLSETKKVTTPKVISNYINNYKRNDSIDNAILDDDEIRRTQPIEFSLSYEPLRERFYHIFQEQDGKREVDNFTHEDLDYLYRLILEQYANENLLNLDEDWLNVGKSKQEENKQQSPTLAQLSAKNYHALVIAAQDYQHWGKLGKPIADADSMIKTVTTFYLFDKQNITYLKNPRRSDLIDAFDSLTEVLTETDNLLIFYAGHGQEDKTLDEGYWIPIDGQKGNRRSNWFSNEELKKYIKAMKCKHVLLVADACFAGKLFRGEQSQPSAKPNIDKTLAIQNDYKKKSRRGITSTKLTTVPDDSIFLKYFLQSLQTNAEKYLRASELHSLFNNILQNNSRQTSENSSIFETGDEGGEFIFIRKE
jgi:hypothetical protein